jgi:hypothetical protein
MVVPTVLYGRHPGWGIPGGAPVPIEVFEGMMDGIEANGLFGLVDLVITGYFATAAQVRAAARVIDAVRESPVPTARPPAGRWSSSTRPWATPARASTSRPRPPTRSSPT